MNWSFRGIAGAHDRDRILLIAPPAALATSRRPKKQTRRQSGSSSVGPTSGRASRQQVWFDRTKKKPFPRLDPRISPPIGMRCTKGFTGQVNKPTWPWMEGKATRSLGLEQARTHLTNPLRPLLVEWDLFASYFATGDPGLPLSNVHSVISNLAATRYRMPPAQNPG